MFGTKSKKGISSIGSFQLSQLNSGSVQAQLKAAGIDTNSKQYKAAIKEMMQNGNGAMYTNIQCIKNSMKCYDKDGDIINVDASTMYNGYYSDSSRMFCIGEVSEEKRRLVQVTKEAMELGLAQVRPWGFLGDMAQAVNDHVTKNGYSVVREIGGHGIGLAFHEDPWVGYIGKRGTEMLMAPGMIFTIEPMVNMGTHEIFVDDGNGWTVYTEDRKPSAQWEIQVLVTETGHEVLCY